MNPLFKWVEGRHKTGYKILTLAWVTSKWSKIPFDVYLFQYPPGSYIPPHRDVLNGADHYRLNIFLTKPSGGEFSSGSIIYRHSRFVLFRPDLSDHDVTPVVGRTRWVLSIGWSVKKRVK